MIPVLDRSSRPVYQTVYQTKHGASESCVNRQRIGDGEPARPLLRIVARAAATQTEVRVGGLAPLHEQVAGQCAALGLGATPSTAVTEA